MKNAIIAITAAILMIAALTGVSAAPANAPNFHFENTGYGSLNWGGYVEQTGTYNQVSASWIVPKVNDTVPGYSSAWVGIGGFNGNSVIQIGTEQDCLSGSTTAGAKRVHGLNQALFATKPTNPGHGNGNGGGKNGGGGSTSTTCTPTYNAWLEMYPQNAEQTLNNSQITLKAGDHITASVTRNTGDSYTMTIDDLDDNKPAFTITETPNFNPDTGSAEVIIERPALCTPHHCSLTSLADFGTIDFSGSTANGQQMTKDNSDSIVMLNKQGQTLADFTQTLLNGGFSMEWLQAS